MKLRKDFNWKIITLIIVMSIVSVLPLFVLVGLDSLNVDWEQSNNWNMVQYGNVKSDYGSFHLYAFTMTMGMFVAVAFSIWKFWRKGIPLQELAWGVIVIIPVGLFFASFFGKLNANGPGQNAGGANFFELFFFWKAGMAIHGGVYGGTIAGLIVFYFLGKKPKVSLGMYADAIIPNVLLGQAIGRFGNFFNHEVMGAPVKVMGNLESYQSENGNAIWNREMQDLTNQAGGSGINWLPDWILHNTKAIYSGSDVVIGGIKITDGDLVQMSPIFFYEALGLFLGWLIITFVIPNIGRWFGKKPWKVEPEKYSIDWKYTTKQFFMPWIKDETKMSWREAFDAAYVKNVDESARNKYAKKIEKINSSNDNFFIRRFKIGSAQKTANNPNKYWETKSGTQAFAYFFVWNFVRFILELERPDDHLFIMYDKPLSLVLIGVTALVGLIGMLLCNSVFPYFVRKDGIMYEKDYLSISDIVTDKPISKKVTLSKTKIDKAIQKEQKAKAKLEKYEK
ncbi:prolipoprotein diacylglyceryl transferase family protein [Mesoplasma photuris]|uniref:prolipoprotein diacylglyceryl transferase family protein n=1 Tax=Mesoplasma photuris TaxID=217731 RepID=UPI00068BBE67|nr:prolipoprotein diacylglyceryl transferase family protein [Mesoplasma photuris]